MSLSYVKWVCVENFLIEFLLKYFIYSNNLIII